MGSVELDKTKTEKDLGVYFSHDLKWKQQVIASAARANSMLGLIRNTFKKFDIRLVRILYMVYVRPLIEFAVPVWSPMLKGDMNLLEKIQHRVTRMVPGLRKLPYSERLEKLGLTTLEERRTRGDLIQTYKIFNGIEKVELCVEPVFREEITRGHKQRYSREVCANETRQNFLTNRIANEWNRLPEEVVSSKTTDEFKARLDRHTNELSNGIRMRLL
jgi:hypothetical protein